MAREHVRQCIIFCQRKRSADKLYQELRKHHKRVATMHGDLAQPLRERIMQAFRDAKIVYLVATDVVGRGTGVVAVGTVGVGKEGVDVTGNGAEGTEGTDEVTERIDVMDVMDGTVGTGRPSASACPLRRPAPSKAARAAARRISPELRRAESGCGVWGISKNPGGGHGQTGLLRGTGLAP